MSTCIDRKNKGLYVLESCSTACRAFAHCEDLALIGKLHGRSTSLGAENVTGMWRITTMFLFPHTLAGLCGRQKKPISETKVRFIRCAKQALNSSSGSSRRKRNAKPYGYWTSEKNVLDELGIYISSMRAAPNDKVKENMRSTGILNRKNQNAVNANEWFEMPTARELEFAGRSDLAGAIRRHGWAKIAKAAGLRLSSVANPRSLNLTFCTSLKLRSGRMRPYCYWRNFDHVRDEVEDVMQLNQMQTLPSARTLLSLGRSDLLRAITIHGGWSKVADRLNIPTASQLQWDSFDTVRAELLRIASVMGKPHECPSTSDIRAHGRRGLISAIRRHHHGLRAVTNRIRNEMNENIERTKFENFQNANVENNLDKVNTENKKKSANMNTNPSNDGIINKDDILHKSSDVKESLGNLKTLVRDCVQLACRHDTKRPTDVMLTKHELLVMGRADVANLVQRHGFRKVAAECGLRMRRKSSKPQNKVV